MRSCLHDEPVLFSDRLFSKRLTAVGLTIIPNELQVMTVIIFVYSSLKF